MLAVLIAPLVLTYQFPPEVRNVYEVQVQFDGYVPVMGGTKGRIDVEMAVAVTGTTPDAKGRPQVVSDIDDFVMKLNGARMPFDKSNVRTYFPKTTISLSPLGKVEATDAPNLSLPVRLPGLDVKRFPDITYLLLEFPESGVEVGQSFDFKKAFGDSTATYHITTESVVENRVKFRVEVHQEYASAEDSRGNPAEGDQIVSDVKTVVDGTGEATFDSNLHQIVAAEIVANAKSTVTDRTTGNETDRALKTTLRVKRRAAENPR